MRTFVLNISYDGTRYKGWQRLPGENTIQGKLEAVLGRILNETVEVSGSGRTDAGAHAMGQTASFHSNTELEADELLCQLRRYLPDDIGIESIREASPRFHARLNAVTKTYRYRIWNDEAPCVFDQRFVYRMPEVLDIPAMEQAAASLLGQHDFASFCANKKFKKSTVRTIYSIKIERCGKEIRMDFTGNGFLYNMVRIMVGTLLEIGRHERAPEEIPGILSAKSRDAAGYTVPAQGLCLMEVTY